MKPNRLLRMFLGFAALVAVGTVFISRSVREFARALNSLPVELAAVQL